MPHPSVRLTWRSLWHTPLATRRTCTSSGPGGSSVTDSTTRGSPGSVRIAARASRDTVAALYGRGSGGANDEPRAGDASGRAALGREDALGERERVGSLDQIEIRAGLHRHVLLVRRVDGGEDEDLHVRLLLLDAARCLD